MESAGSNPERKYWGRHLRVQVRDRQHRHLPRRLRMDNRVALLRAAPSACEALSGFHVHWRLPQLLASIDHQLTQLREPQSDAEIAIAKRSQTCVQRLPRESANLSMVGLVSGSHPDLRNGYDPDAPKG